MKTVPYSIRISVWLQRLVCWEFWPWRVVYIPIAVYWFFLAIKARGAVFFSAANPSMRFGGLLAYSKIEVTKLVPKAYLPQTIFIQPTQSIAETVAQVKQADMRFPLIIKPDEGERGKGVQVLDTPDELLAALHAAKEPMLLQVYENLPMEFGIMYSRHPDEKKGKITSVVIKEFPTIEGDGKRTVLEHILSNHRLRLSYKVHVKRHAHRLHEVLPKGEKLQIVQIGNHMLGTTFLNGNHLISSQLETVFDELAKQIAGFYIGRFDVRASSAEALLHNDFKVIEVNGVNSEPCHIFHPGRSLLLAWRDLFKHWNRIAQISIANHKNGVPYASYWEIRKAIRKHNQRLAHQD